MWLALELVLGPPWVTSREKCKSDHVTWGPPKAYFQAYIIHCNGLTGFVVGEAKEVLLLQMSRDHGKEMPFYYYYYYY